MIRFVEREWLDELSSTDPLAVANRADLRHLNAVMGTAEWFGGALAGLARRPGRLLELGAGEGDLACGLGEVGWEVDGLDVCGAPQGWPRSRCWHQVSVETFAGWSEYEGICVNLLLHQLDDEVLAAVGERIQGSAVSAVVAQEPWRSRWAQGMFLGASVLLGMSAVSRHDGWVSIRAGFDGEELPAVLGLGQAGWRWRIDRTGLGLYRMVAWRS